MSKINVLVVPSDRAGVSKFRSIDPHLYLEKMYPDDFKIDIHTHGIKLNTNPNYLKQYQIIHFHRSAVDWAEMKAFADLVKKLGIILIMDLDDHWRIPSVHPLFAFVKQHELDKKIITNLQLADYVTTTTSIFANDIRNINKNVVVLPNGIDDGESQFQVNPEKSDKIRMGWLGGSSHLADLEIIKNITTLFYDNKDLQFVLCGFDLRGEKTEMNRDTGQVTKRPILPQESVWYQYEKFFTEDYRLLGNEYSTFLGQFKKDDNNKWNNERYRRVWTKPITSYAENYNLFDIALAPLKEHDFNRVKSQLKVVEAGFHKKAIIAQDFGPYTIDLVNGQNGLLVDSVKNHKQWVKHLKTLIKNPNMIKDLGEALYETVNPKYHLKTISKTRKEFYQSVINKKVVNKLEEVI